MIIKKEKSKIENFLVDAANYRGNCSAVCFPKNEAEVIKVVKEANKNNTKITIAGNGTGLTGARVPEGGIVISMSKMDEIIEIDREKSFAKVEPAVILSDFKKIISCSGLFYPPDPTEQNCFVGATIATNSSGAKSFKYGATRSYVLALRVILVTGEILELERGKNFANGSLLKLITTTGKEIEIDLPNYSIPKTKHTAGYISKQNMDAIDLFIGSEGTLGIITEAKLRLLDKPEDLISGIIFFNNELEALDFVDDVRAESIKHRANKDESNINARGLEYFDYNSLQFLKEDYQQINNIHKAAVWFEQEITSETEDSTFAKWVDLLEKYSADVENSWFAMSKKEREDFENFRHAISSKITDVIVQNGMRKVGTDTAVPVDKFREYYFEVKSSVEDNNLNYVYYGHIGDCHLHMNMLPQNESEMLVAKELYKKFCKRAVELGGTISAEHGIGKMKRDYLLDMYGKENIKQMAKIKRELDPNRLLGIGNIFTENFLYA